MTKEEMQLGESLEQLPPTEAFVYRETKDGRPVISGAEFQRLYHTDIRALGEEHVVTFDFQGFVKEEREQYPEGLIYKDVLATNGLLKSDVHEGIHIGIDGVIDYGEAPVTGSPLDSTEVGEYDMYVTIPPALQKEKGCFCRNDKCYPLSEWNDELDGDLAEFYGRSEPSWVVMRLPFYPPEDSLARKKAGIINAALIRHIEQGGPLHDIEHIIRNVQEELKTTRIEALEKRAAELRA